MPPQPVTAAPPQPRAYLTTFQKIFLIRFLESILFFFTNFLLIYYLNTVGVLIVRALDELRRYYGDISLADFLYPDALPDRRQQPPGVTFTVSEIPATATSADLPESPPDVRLTALAMRGGRDCSICLETFVEGDMCRRLGDCKHVFHSGCVDRWLQKKRTCPVCRMRVESPVVSWVKEFLKGMR